MQELTITRVEIKEKDGKNEVLKDKNGNRYKRIGIQVDYVDYDGKWLSHLAYGPDDKCLGLKVGDRVKLRITSNGEYLNFDLPTRTDLLEERVQRLEKWVEQINLKLGTKAAPQKETEAPW